MKHVFIKVLDFLFFIILLDSNSLLGIILSFKLNLKLLIHYIICILLLEK